MTQPSTDRFLRRNNGDGTFDSICRDCFSTVAASNREEELEKLERAHVCSPWERQRLEHFPGRKPN